MPLLTHACFSFISSKCSLFLPDFDSICIFCLYKEYVLKQVINICSSNMALENGFEFLHVIISLAILLFTAKVFAEIFHRLKMPIVLGELLAGIIIGPFAFGFQLTPHINESLHTLMYAFSTLNEMSWLGGKACIGFIKHHQRIQVPSIDVLSY